MQRTTNQNETSGHQNADPNSDTSSLTSPRMAQHVSQPGACIGYNRTSLTRTASRQLSTVIEDTPIRSESLMTAQASNRQACEKNRVFEGIFDTLCGESPGMDRFCFCQLCKDSYLIGGHFQHADLDSVFAQVVPNGRSHMTLRQLDAALRHVAARKGVDSDYPRRVVEALAGGSVFRSQAHESEHFSCNAGACGGA